MHGNHTDSDCIAETDTHDYYERETHFIGDSMTAEAMQQFERRMDEGFAEIKGLLRHILSHDPGINPVPGCELCEARRAA